MNYKTNIIVLAAGEGKRFFSSGGQILKQLVPFDGVPLLRRILLQIKELNIETNIIVVVGEDDAQEGQIKECLADISGVRYVKNLQSRSDNNFYSVKSALQHCKLGPSLVIEADCVFETDDLKTFSDHVIDSTDIVWGCIGSANKYDHGGILVHLNGCWEPKITQGDEFQRLSQDPKALKMFGLVGIPLNQSGLFFDQVASAEYKTPKYFHQVFFDSTDCYSHTVFDFGAKAFSFNTKDELNSNE